MTRAVDPRLDSFFRFGDVRLKEMKERRVEF